MRDIKVISQLCLKNGELVCKDDKGRLQAAHYKQGDLDGACGIYSLVDIVSILGLFKADTVWNDDKVDGRTASGKFLKLIHEYNKRGIYKDGLEVDEAIGIIENSFGRNIESTLLEETDAKGNLVDMIVQFIDQDLPVMQRISFRGGAHWIVIVGYMKDNRGHISHLLTLDPGEARPQLTLWNGTIEVKESKSVGYKRAYYTSNPRDIKLEEAIVFSPLS